MLTSKNSFHLEREGIGSRRKNGPTSKKSYAPFEIPTYKKKRERSASLKENQEKKDINPP